MYGRTNKQTGVSQYPHFFFEKRRDNNDVLQTQIENRNKDFTWANSIVISIEVRPAQVTFPVILMSLSGITGSSARS